MNITASRLIRWAGVSAMLAGFLFVAIQPIHPPDVLSSVSTDSWVVVTSLKFAFGLLGLLGLAGIYARQANQVGWLGLAGYLLFSVFLALTAVFAFAQAFILPLVAADAPRFVEGFLGLATGTASEVSLGPIPTVYGLAGIGYLVGTLTFGIATFRAGVLPRWAAGMLALAGPLSIIAVQLLPHALERFAAAPGGIALAWLGYAVWTERRAHASEHVPREAMAQAGQIGAA